MLEVYSGDRVLDVNSGLCYKAWALSSCSLITCKRGGVSHIRAPISHGDVELCGTSANAGCYVSWAVSTPNHLFWLLPQTKGKERGLIFNMFLSDSKSVEIGCTSLFEECIHIYLSACLFSPHQLLNTTWDLGKRSRPCSSHHRAGVERWLVDLCTRVQGGTGRLCSQELDMDIGPGGSCECDLSCK